MSGTITRAHVVAWLREHARSANGCAEIPADIVFEAVASYVARCLPLQLPDDSQRLADACEALHMAHTGSAEPLEEAEEEAHISFLVARLATWRPTVLPASARYDAAYRALVEATLAECGVSLPKPALSFDEVRPDHDAAARDLK